MSGRHGAAVEGPFLLPMQHLGNVLLGDAGGEGAKLSLRGLCLVRSQPGARVKLSALFLLRPTRGAPGPERRDFDLEGAQLDGPNAEGGYAFIVPHALRVSIPSKKVDAVCEAFFEAFYVAKRGERPAAAPPGADYLTPAQASARPGLSWRRAIPQSSARTMTTRPGVAATEGRSLAAHDGRSRTPTLLAVIRYGSDSRPRLCDPDRPIRRRARPCSPCPPTPSSSPSAHSSALRPPPTPSTDTFHRHPPPTPSTDTLY